MRVINQLDKTPENRKLLQYCTEEHWQGKDSQGVLKEFVSKVMKGDSNKKVSNTKDKSRLGAVKRFFSFSSRVSKEDKATKIVMNTLNSPTTPDSIKNQLQDDTISPKNLPKGTRSNRGRS